MNGYLSTHIEVNFVPKWYVESQREKQLIRRLLVLGGLLMAGLIWWVVDTWQTQSGLSQYQSGLTEMLSATEERITEVQKLRSHRVELTRKLRVHRELYQPVTFSQIAGTIAYHTPESVSLTTMDVTTYRVEVAVKEEKAKPGTKSRRRGRSGKKQNKQKHYRSTIKVMLEGIAPSDVDVANYIAALSGCRLFQKVKIDFSRYGRFENLETRRFRVTMEIPLDKAYVMPMEEVADAK